jgi:VPDSG-CTERM motif
MTKLLKIAALTAAASVVAYQAQAQTYSTVGSWNGSDDISAFGNPNTATYGETFIAPAGASLLDSYTFYIEGSATLTMQGIVGPWGGSLFGGSSPQGTTSISYTGADQVYSSSGGGFVPVTVTIPGGVAVTPGAAYFMGLTISGASEYANSAGTTEWGNIFNNGIPQSLGGGFNFYNNGNDFGALTTSSWDDFENFGTLAFSATFTGTGNQSVPDAGTTSGMFGIALAGLAALRRKLS